MEQQMYKQYLVIGDWSDDGHGKYRKELLQSNYPVEVIQQAYKDSCRLTGVSFNHNEDYTGLNRHYSESEKYQIATEYESGCRIPPEAFKLLKDFNFEKHEYYSEDLLEEDGGYYWESEFEDLWIWFVKLSLPEDAILEKANVVDEIPNINGYWNKNLNVQFGYGLFH